MTPDPARFDRRLIAPMLVGSVLNPINSSMLAVVLVPIGAAFGVPASQTAWLVTGVATSIGVESTARAAYEHGYNVTLAIDAITDLATESHEHSPTRIFPRLGETGTTAEIIALLG